MFGEILNQAVENRKLHWPACYEPSPGGQDVKGTFFNPVEQCNLDYDPLRGSAIDPHLDDSWLWGEHLVTINLLSDTVLTMSLDRGWGDMDDGEVRVAVHSPRRSLIVLYGEARHRWKHAIHRKDIHRRRACSSFSCLRSF
ncbi:alpha-ketoglutarate-dependent dioxygenase alkB homolog 4 [Sinocyclocheilus grahami]|uniref:alpha-ketoglutarate-dependent dioxygenase alkB homolog 4 n=1 Tax=Sinocyclocheilus grahami TaxID=75366 RepID=UPI0007AD6027|nr:PREDICTED: alpha-ketoglutarate-dependent dioxygenase alkB homolog 4 [Sinocyclocheilus grahami]